MYKCENKYIMKLKLLSPRGVTYNVIMVQGPATNMETMAKTSVVTGTRVLLTPHSTVVRSIILIMSGGAEASVAGLWCVRLLSVLRKITTAAATPVPPGLTSPSPLGLPRL